MNTRHLFALASLGVASAFGTACHRPEPAAAPASIAPSSEFSATSAPVASNDLPVEPLVTLQDLMKHEVDYSADRIWDASGRIITAKGTQDLRPKTDAEWDEVRHHAVVLVEATNLLVIPNRKVAAVPFPSDGPGVNSSDQIQQQIDAHRDQFDAFALGLRAVAQQELAAIERHDADKLLQLGDDMDSACEACHKANWYPHEVVPPPPANPPSP